jgi:hypothetical protein
VASRLRASGVLFTRAASAVAGWTIIATAPSSTSSSWTSAGDPEEAILRAVNDTKDNDTVAAIVGAAVGALHGRRRRGSPARDERYRDAITALVVPSPSCGPVSSPDSNECARSAAP